MYTYLSAYDSRCCPHIHRSISFHAYMLPQYCVFLVLAMLYLYIPSMISLVFSYSYGFWIDIHCNLLIFSYHPFILYVQTTWLLHLNTSNNVNFNISHLLYQVIHLLVALSVHLFCTYNIILLRMILFIYI